MRLEDRTALITGGNTGIGRAICEAYAREGARVAVGWFEDEGSADALATELARHGPVATAVHLDVTDEASVATAVARASETLGTLNVLVNNAGIQRASPILDTSLAQFDRMLAVHLRGAFLCSRAVAPAMCEAGDGRIINVCSQLGYIGRGNYTAYSAAKGGLIAFTRALAKELAPHGVLVNGVAPGLVDTGFDPLPEEVKTAHALALPLGRLGTPEDMTSAFVFLAGPESRYYCGQLLHPNGGEIMP